MRMQTVGHINKEGNRAFNVIEISNYDCSSIIYESIHDFADLVCNTHTE